MTIAVKPKFQSAVADDPSATAAGEITPSRWNQGSDLTMATARLLGRATAGDGAAEELTAAQARTLLELGAAALLAAGTAAGNVPVLDANGQLATSVLPALALTDVFEVGSQAAMLALTAQRGDIAIRTDLNKTFALAADAPATLANWKELRTPTDVVLSVAGLTGTITAAALKTALFLAIGDIVGLTDAISDRASTDLSNVTQANARAKVGAGSNAYIDKATVAQVRAASGDAGLTADLLSSAVDLVTLTDAATIAINWASFVSAQVTLGGNRTLGNPSGAKAGSTVAIVVRAASGTRTLSFGTNYKGDLPTINDVSSTKWYLLTLFAYSETHIVVSSVRAL